MKKKKFDDKTMTGTITLPGYGEIEIKPPKPGMELPEWCKKRNKELLGQLNSVLEDSKDE